MISGTASSERYGISSGRLGNCVVEPDFFELKFHDDDVDSFKHDDVEVEGGCLLGSSSPLTDFSKGSTDLHCESLERKDPDLQQELVVEVVEKEVEVKVREVEEVEPYVEIPFYKGFNRRLEKYRNKISPNVNVPCKRTIGVFV